MQTKTSQQDFSCNCNQGRLACTCQKRFNISRRNNRLRRAENVISWILILLFAISLGFVWAALSTGTLP